MSTEIQINPIKGLLPYNAGDSEFYHIDKTHSEAFFRQLKKNKFVILSGDTGSGKTSFVNCIFDKKFKELNNIDDQWNVVYIRPGLNPIKSISFFLSNSKFSEDKLSNEFVEEITNLLISDSNGLFELFNKYKIKQGEKLLMVIDPMDDLFLLDKVMQSSDNFTAEQHINAFINLLYTFERQCKELPIYLVISFSNNFPEKVGQYPKFLDLIERNKFLFKNTSIENVQLLIDEVIPENVKEKAKDYALFKEKVKNDLKELFSDTVEWLFFLQHALKRTVDLWNENNERGLIQCYYDAGGVKESIIRHAESIYLQSVGHTDKKHQKIYELVFRALMDAKGQFVAKTYKNVVEESTRLDREEAQYLEEKYIKPFILAMAEKELGFFEIIRTLEESERAVSLIDKEYIANGDVISVRNKCLVPRWPRLEKFQSARLKLIYEYEWYSRIALINKDTGKENYPTTLQAYALADKKRDKGKDPEEFKVIDELLCINAAWEAAYFDKARKDFASLDDTKSYIRKGLSYWIEKASVAEKERRKKETAKSRRIVLISLITVAAFIIAFPIYRMGLKQFDDMKVEFDALVAENSRIISFLDSMQIAKLREHALRNQVPDTVVDALEYHAKFLTDTIKSNSKDINNKANTLYMLSEWGFMMDHSRWMRIRDTSIARSVNLYEFVLNSAIKDKNLTTVDSTAISKDLWNKYNNVREMKEEDYKKLIYVQYKGVKGIPCTSLPKNGAPLDSAYFLQCEICEK